MRLFYAIISLCMLLTAGCHRQEHDPRLLRVADLAEHSYEEALTALDSIDPKEFSTGDRHFYDLLTIKANDKAFVTHTSDSLILDVISYYENHKDDPYYPEALYYGGRVYSDLGDYPTSLSYFRTALDILPPERKNNDLRGKILSHTSSILNSLRLYDKALPYAEEVLQIDSIENDPFNLMLDNIRIGSIHMRSDNQELAERNFRKARHLAESINEEEVARVDGFLAASRYNADDPVSALTLIRAAMKDSSFNEDSFALSYACKIYKSNNIKDSAILFARRLINSDSHINKQNAYHMLLAPDMIRNLPQDSIAIYVSDYRDVVEAYLHEYGQQETLIQNSIYNYQTHEKLRMKAEIDNSRLRKWIVSVSIILVIAAFTILIIRYRSKSRLLQLHELLRKLDFLQKELEATRNKEPQQTITPTFPHTTKTDLQRAIHEKLKSIESESTQVEIDPIIFNSEAYSELQEALSTNVSLSENNPIWKRMEEVVLTAYPDFRYRWNLLTGGMKGSYYNHALLIKFGITPTQIAKLIARSKTTVTYQRNKIIQRILDKEADVKSLDRVIRLL